VNAEPSPAIGICRFCRTPTTADNWCGGCRAFVCASCDRRPRFRDAYGAHAPTLHRPPIAERVGRDLRAAARAMLILGDAAPNLPPVLRDALDRLREALAGAEEVASADRVTVSPPPA
jgi:hypothetical protein